MARAPSIHPPEQGTYPVSRHVARIEGLIADLRGAGHRADADCLARGLAALESPAHEVEGMPVDIVTALGDPNFKNFRVGPTGLTCVDVQVAGRQPAVHTLALAMLRARLLSPASGCDAAGVRDDWHALLSGYGALHAPPVAQRVALLCRALIFHGNRWSAPPVIRTRLGSYIDLLVTTDPLAG